MKNIILLLLIMVSCKSYTQQTIVPLRTYTDIPEDAGYYIKDTNNELQAFEGTWKGIWNGKIFSITFKKITNKYNPTMKYNSDIIVGKFKMLANNGNILFDNTNLSDINAKIEGTGFQNITNKYLLFYVDNDICNISGDIELVFTNVSKMEMNFSYHQNPMILTADCYFYGWPQADRPQPLPRTDIILVKQ
ncbi:DUF6705 family protein [Chryseobacterium sp. 5_R23647]|uniref:DUF6705 family protein n=1 Tax=Chryseobacterium sp. 5_R23647 TaxID=2258964 RepID=UPI000E25E208|nr:DUF6705 family protein [Chryseobacterium sp. 5_R23647]REC43985.1 hypothetical protein DRF69_07140 [Chryseobacterium sp. 5_R23647]